MSGLTMGSNAAPGFRFSGRWRRRFVQNGDYYAMHVEEILAASDGRVALAWVIHDGEAVHVRTFRHLRPGHRPAVFCPVCERQVTPKLGEKRAPHAAHHKGAVCPTTDPDFALYVNATFSLAEALRVNLLQIVDPERCRHGVPFRVIRSDNGPEFVSMAVLGWRQ